MKSIHVLLAFSFFLVSHSICGAQTELKQTESMPGYLPKEGFVPDQGTAITIAIAVLVPIYGEAEIREKHPFSATLKNGKWTVVGSLPKNAVGGVPEVQLSKLTGRILKVSSGK